MKNNFNDGKETEVIIWIILIGITPVIKEKKGDAGNY